ncbi:MAG: hypothetical protein SVT52_08090, partial [Planctomycetota bacterium]|nr:hypothetical protein [Planctomycetota bacterium]
FISEGARGLDGTIYFAEDVAAPARLYIYRPPSLPAFADWDEPKRVLRLKDSERRFPSPELQVASTDIDTSGLAISGETTVALRLINEGTLGKGEIELRPLNRYARSGEIAPDAMSIAGVCTSRDAKLFAVTQGIKSHFVSYDHNPRHQHVMNIGVLYEGPVEAGGAVCLSDDTLITWVTPKDGSATALWHYDHQHDCMVFRMKFANVLEPFDVQIGRVAAMAASGKTVAALLEDGAVLILDEKLNTLEKFTGGGIASQKPLLICGRGDRYLCCINGTEVLEISNKTKTPEILIDSKSSPITALASGGEIVAYGTEAGEIKVIKGGGELRSGKAGWRKPVRCLCLTEDGTAWAVAGAGVGHLFRFAAADSEPVSYQTPAANFPYWWVGYEVDHIAPGPGGCLYLAETGRLAHLLIFYPDKG